MGIGKNQYRKTYNFTHGTYSRPHKILSGFGYKIRTLLLSWPSLRRNSVRPQRDDCGGKFVTSPITTRCPSRQDIRINNSTQLNTRTHLEITPPPPPPPSPFSHAFLRRPHPSPPHPHVALDLPHHPPPSAPPLPLIRSGRKQSSTTPPPRRCVRRRIRHRHEH